MESIPFLEYANVTFWVQFHNILLKNLTYETGELIGRTFGTVMAMADPEDDRSGGEFLRVRITMDITKSLPRCLKLRSEGKQRRLVGIVRLNFINHFVGFIPCQICLYFSN